MTCLNFKGLFGKKGSIIRANVTFLSWQKSHVDKRNICKNVFRNLPEIYDAAFFQN